MLTTLTLRSPVSGAGKRAFHLVMHQLSKWFLRFASWSIIKLHIPKYCPERNYMLVLHL